MEREMKKRQVFDSLAGHHKRPPALVPAVSTPLDHREGSGGVQHLGKTAQVGCYQHLLNTAI